MSKIKTGGLEECGKV